MNPRHVRQGDENPVFLNFPMGRVGWGSITSSLELPRSIAERHSPSRVTYNRDSMAGKPGRSGRPNRPMALESHPMRERVERALFDGQSAKQIRSWIQPILSCNSILKYKHKLGASLAIVRAARQSVNGQSNIGNTMVDTSSDLSLVKAVQMGDPLLSRIERKYSRLDAGLIETYENKDFSAAAKLETAETQAMRLHAELEGRLSSTQASQVTIQVAMIGFQPAASTPQPTMIEAEVVD